MNVFEYLISTDVRIERELHKIVKNYSHWSHDRTEQESTKIFKTIASSLRNKQLLLANNLDSPEGMEPTLEESFLEESEIQSEIQKVAELQLEKHDCRPSLLSLTAKMRKHRKFCEEIFYPQMQARLSPGDILRMNKQLIQLL